MINRPDYILSKTYRYNNEVVYIYTNGSHYVFASGILDTTENKIDWHTISDPTPIGNAPYN